jgi:hypothetical protein
MTRYAGLLLGDGGASSSRLVGGMMEGKARIVFPIVATALVVFVVSAVVTFVNIGFGPHFVRRWLTAFIIGWPVASLTGYIAFPFVRRVTVLILEWLEGERV